MVMYNFLIFPCVYQIWNNAFMDTFSIIHAFKNKESKQVTKKLFEAWLSLYATSNPLWNKVWIKYESESGSGVSDPLRLHGLFSLWNSPGQNAGVGSLSLLPRVFPTQGLNPGLPHCRWILYQLSHKGSPRILEWVANPSSSGSSQPRNRTRVSCIAGRFFTNWGIGEAYDIELLIDYDIESVKSKITPLLRILC